jgi:hypothetical protein
LNRRAETLTEPAGGGVFEVYPAAALRCWKLDGNGYKTRGGVALRKVQRDARERVLDELRDRAPWLDISAARDACLDSDDALDALIAALTARAASMRLTLLPDPDEVERAKTEGWIHLPRAGSLGRLTDRADA